MNLKTTQPRQRIEVSFTDVEWKALVALVRNPRVKDIAGGQMAPHGSGKDLGWTRVVMNTIERADVEWEIAKVKHPKTLTHRILGSRS